MGNPNIECNKKLIDALKAELLRRAEKRFPGKALGPCGDRNHLSECYTIDKMDDDFTVLMFYYNIGINTHTESIVFDHSTQEELLGGKENDRGKKD